MPTAALTMPRNLTVRCRCYGAPVSSRSALSIRIEPRGQTRHKVFLPAEMAGSAGASRVHLLNLSPAGALVHGDSVPLPGAVVRFSCARVSWLARVVWSEHKRFGVVHVTRMGEAALDALVAGQAG